ncbi:hypothetical protein CKALI_11320 [Corynebacterium kalinowskii]|uniref:Uncharacterized protein n=1 Tax=Corynebacterium kalinowskii TaxID=2675216 RepID=A0A6B8W7P1_9CORY|nr:hypothetical protein [Corynebacterium kalinowskii]QGU03108.1 hypothetical protein CKALI_11320 [Corynebacterium kalinowskii]
MISDDKATEIALEIASYLQGTDFYPELISDIDAGEDESACFTAIGNLGLTKTPIPAQLLDNAVDVVKLRWESDPDVMQAIDEWKPLVNTI